MTTAVPVTTSSPRSGAGPEAAAALAARRARARRRLLGRGLLYAGAVLLALWVLVPIYLITVTAFSPRDAVYSYPKPLIPETLSADTMDFFVNSTGVLGSLWNSVLVALVTLLLSTLIGAPARAYPAGAPIRVERRRVTRATRTLFQREPRTPVELTKKSMVSAERVSGMSGFG